MIRLNGRIKTVVLFGIAIIFLIVVTMVGAFFSEAAMVTDFSRKDLAPGARYLFGTDWLGREIGRAHV